MSGTGLIVQFFVKPLEKNCPAALIGDSISQGEERAEEP
jgi:hypothetical protein